MSSSQREYGNAKLERTKAEQERARKEEELQRLKEIALKEQEELHEKRSQKLVEDFLRMKSLTVKKRRKKNNENEIDHFLDLFFFQILQKHFSAWLNVVLERRLQMGRASALADWKLLFQ